jgi:hypothetical protein
LTGAKELYLLSGLCNMATLLKTVWMNEILGKRRRQVLAFCMLFYGIVSRYWRVFKFSSN